MNDTPAGKIIGFWCPGCGIYVDATYLRHNWKHECSYRPDKLSGAVRMLVVYAGDVSAKKKP